MANTTMSPYIITVHVLFEKCNFKLELNEVLCNKVVIYMKKYEDIYKKMLQQTFTRGKLKQVVS